MSKLISTITLLAAASISLNAAGASNKQPVCHKGGTISIGQQAVSAHLAHGDTEGECEEGAPRPKTKTAVVMMRCTAVDGNGVVVVAASSSTELLDAAMILPIPLPEEGDVDCAGATAGLLNMGFGLRSINSGTAEDGEGALKLYTDYVLTGKVPQEE